MIDCARALVVRGRVFAVTRNRFDKVAKRLGQDALGPSGITVAHDEIIAEAQYADLRHEPDPDRSAARERLGLLGRLAATPCLIEAYSQAVDFGELRACVAKHLAWWRSRVRDARNDNRKRSERGEPARPFVEPALWIITAGAPVALLAELAVVPAPDWPAGVYLLGGSALRVGIVVASELTRDTTTLLVRVMAAGPLLSQAVRELNALPVDAYERVVVEPVLLELYRALDDKPNRTPDDEEFMMVMYKTWEEHRTEGRLEGRTEGRTEGRLQAQANSVLAVLRVRDIAVPEAVRQMILAETDPARLERWLERAAVAASLDDVISSPA